MTGRRPLKTPLFVRAMFPTDDQPFVMPPPVAPPAPYAPPPFQQEQEQQQQQDEAQGGAAAQVGQQAADAGALQHQAGAHAYAD